MLRNVPRPGLVALAAALASGAVLVTAASAVPARAELAKKQPILRGFAQGKAVRYFDFGTIRLKSGNAVSTLWRVEGGAPGQRVVIAAVPGRPGYSALARVKRVVWKPGTTPRILRSSADISGARAKGEVTVATTKTIVNAPVLGFGQTRHSGFARGATIHYYELGKVAVAPGNEILPIWTFTNGVADQANIADVEPGTTDYPPLWAVVKATWKDGAEKRLITSYEALLAAQKAGEITLESTPDVVNCPFL